VAPDARLLALRACWADPPDAEGANCTSFTLAKALQHALSQRARIINLSLTGPRDRLLERLLDVAAERGIVLVGAAHGQAAQFPAAHPSVIAVSVLPGGATSTIAAPGTNILSTAPNASWGYVSGSSFSAAQVSGVAALLLERSPSLTPDSLRQMLAPPAARPAVLDACAALARAGYGVGGHTQSGSATAPAGC